MDSLISLATRFVKNTSKYYNFFLKDENNNNLIIGDYREQKKLFKYTNIEKKSFFITNVVILVVDNDNIKPDFYGSDLSLDNGIRFYVKGLFHRRDIFEEPIITNLDWLKYNCKTEFIKFGTVNTIKVTFNFHLDTNSFIRLLPTESIVFEVNDNFTSLLQHTVNITGHYGEK